MKPSILEAFVRTDVLTFDWTVHALVCAGGGGRVAGERASIHNPRGEREVLIAARPYLRASDCTSVYGRRRVGVMSLEILKGQNELLQHEVEVAIKENRIAEAIYIATTRSIGYVHTHDHTGEVQRIPSTDPVRDLELLNVEVPVPGGVTALIRAAQFADSKSLEQLIALGVDVEYETIGGLTAFAEACKAGHQQICETLIHHGVDVNRHNRFDETPLIQSLRTACSNNFLRWLLDSTAVEVTTEAVLEAGCQSEHQLLFLLLDHGGHINAVSPRTQHTLLTQACEAGAGGTAIVCIDRGATIDFETPSGHTALSQAAYFGHVPVVNLLLGHGAQVDFETKTGNTALNQACIAGQAPVARILLEKGADPNRTNMYGHSPLTLAARFGHAEMINVLCARKTKVNKETSQGGRIALVEACIFNHPAVVEALLRQPDTSVNVETRSEMAMHLTPLVAAAWHGSIDVIPIIMKTLKWGGKRNGVALYQETCEMIGPIDACVKRSRPEMTRTLLTYMSDHCKSTNLVKERNSRNLFCTALKDYILKAEEFSSLIDKMKSELKEAAEEVCEALKQTLQSETAKIDSLRKKHFDGMRIEELTDQWESMRMEDRGGKKGRYLLEELDTLDSELAVKLKFGHLEGDDAPGRTITAPDPATATEMSKSDEGESERAH